ncbi:MULTISPECIES: hemolysin family protein [unclassified Psychrobacillus]|uniref:hemolysin family protein n=1 Tax=unclassified Psychrobacillus TaxID=2636677 RepID=UPI00146C3D04|nr:MULTISPECIES: hemolysin family protein [unclassified Psychrobacillus]MCM3357229.1 hemolysin family protein [Psychrobacillus sp. MER TA 171]NME04541.1 HlyC/CorC family transporter [Psychrobacillus sp. BL-248-WT-3]
MTALNLTIFVILIALTAFFVATEFAIVKVRHSRIDQLVAEGRKGSKAAKQVTSRLDEYLSACQLGITVTALGIGMVGESTFEFILHPLFETIGISTDNIHYFTIGAAFLIATFLHVVVGELAPKTIAIQKAEAVTLVFAKPIMIFYKILYPFIWFLNGSARLLVGLFGMRPASEHELSHTEEELRLLLAESYKSGEINQNELKYVNNVFEFDDRIAREIMVPRTQIIGFERKATFNEVLTTISEERYTRYPVYEEDRDNIIGFINIKDFLTLGINNRITLENFNIEDFVNPVINTIETTPINSLLLKMQKERIHMAILLDEYGGTSGLVTVEDILEEIVGEIRDEFDDDEIADVRKVKEDHYIIHTNVLLDDVAKLLKIDLYNPDVDTIGGWYYTQDIELHMDEQIEYGGYIFSINEKQDNHIQFIEVQKFNA